jgi:hypothetical protein
MTSVVQHVVRCFTPSRSLVFLFKFSGHSVVFAVFCEVSCILAVDGAIGHPLCSSPSSAFVSAMGASTSSPTTCRLIKTLVLLVRQWPLGTLLRRAMLWLFSQIIDCVEWPYISLTWGWWWPKGPAYLPPQVASCLSLLYIVVRPSVLPHHFEQFFDRSGVISGKV